MRHGSWWQQRELKDWGSVAGQLLPRQCGATSKSGDAVEQFHSFTLAPHRPQKRRGAELGIWYEQSGQTEMAACLKGAGAEREEGTVEGEGKETKGLDDDEDEVVVVDDGEDDDETI